MFFLTDIAFGEYELTTNCQVGFPLESIQLFLKILERKLFRETKDQLRSKAQKRCSPGHDVVSKNVFLPRKFDSWTLSSLENLGP